MATSSQPATTPAPAPSQSDVDAVRELLDLMASFADNDQRARYLLSSNWMRDRDGTASTPTVYTIHQHRRTQMLRLAAGVRGERMTAVPPCPSWCTLPASHNADDVDGRFHYAPSPPTVQVIFDDGDRATESGGAWHAEVVGTDHQRNTREDLAADLRATAAELVTAAEWLEARP